MDFIGFLLFIIHVRTFTSFYKRLSSTPKAAGARGPRETARNPAKMSRCIFHEIRLDSVVKTQKNCLKIVA